MELSSILYKGYQYAIYILFFVMVVLLIATLIPFPFPVKTDVFRKYTNPSRDSNIEGLENIGDEIKNAFERPLKQTEKAILGPIEDVINKIKAITDDIKKFFDFLKNVFITIGDFFKCIGDVIKNVFTSYCMLFYIIDVGRTMIYYLFYSIFWLIGSFSGIDINGIIYTMYEMVDDIGKDFNNGTSIFEYPQTVKDHCYGCTTIVFPKFPDMSL